MSPQFLAKTHVPSRPETALQPCNIPALGPFVGPDLPADQSLCAVRAIKYYLARTKDIRGDQHALLVSYKPGHSGAICPATISGWIRKTIKYCYEQSSAAEACLIQARPHDLRAQAASWNAYRNASLDSVMASAQWRHHTTFTSFYLRDMTEVEDDILHLGPIIAAGSRVS